MRRAGWTGVIAAAGVALAGCTADRYLPPPGLALVDDLPPGSTGYTCRTVADSDRLTAQLQDGETMIACPPGIIPGSVYRDENRARLVARPRGWSVYAVPPAPPSRAARPAAPSPFGDHVRCLLTSGPIRERARMRCEHLRQ